MASMRKLRRQLRRHERYAARTPSLRGTKTPAYWRIRQAIDDLLYKRTYAGRFGPNGECYCGGCIGMGPCDDDLGFRQCSTCSGAGRCPDCGGEDDLGCGECGGSLSCWDCNGTGAHVDDYFFIPSRRTETVTPVGGIL